MESILFHLQGCILSRKELLRHNPLENYTEEELIKIVEDYGQIIPAIIPVENQLLCQRCHNQEKFYQDVSHQLSYCLNCIQFGRLSQQDKLYYLPARNNIHESIVGKLAWQGQLTQEQSQIAEQLIRRIKYIDKADLVHAVTGAGKTEMLFPLIQQVIINHGRVCIASPRIDVCLELYPRIQAAFPHCNINLRYGMSTEKISYSPICISTTHQLYRYKEAFDLLIVDEVDSFPYVNDSNLHWAVKRAVKQNGKLVYLTATPDAALEKSIKNKEVFPLVLPARFHRQPLPEPDFIWIGNWRKAIQKKDLNSKLYGSLQKFAQVPGSKLIFMPNIALAEDLYQWLSNQWTLPMAVVHAQDPLRKEKVQSLRESSIDLLITTTILERGVTFPQCQVFVVGAEHAQFNKSSLVQISGRVGRKKEFPDGVLIYGHYGKSKSMIKARKEIQRMNQLAQLRGLIDESK